MSKSPSSTTQSKARRPLSHTCQRAFAALIHAKNNFGIIPEYLRLAATLDAIRLATRSEIVHRRNEPLAAPDEPFAAASEDPSLTAPIKDETEQEATGEGKEVNSANLSESTKHINELMAGEEQSVTDSFQRAIEARLKEVDVLMDILQIRADGLDDTKEDAGAAAKDTKEE
ncbi:hypothetical protein TI39_contig306g00011 [Zymoseptoria brevis]|uniref:Uncharacterized protein n=1 Tax=Zymoseptoria brevis TaxID=1047168 RepID=A0A0F4GVE3_9PEZI|nr:hypothetical protein TI39_contig306g00011 [Zymoseptoria brevis]